MIKFFRKIRQNLLSEGETGKYLKYSIGEIILVVIGILIALQMNEWKDQRKNQESFAQYRDNLIVDLVNDSLSISNTIKNIQRYTAMLAEFEKRVYESEAPLDTIVQIARYEFVYYINLKMEQNNDTYEVLNSTGDISLFSKEVIRDLNSLYALMKEADKLQEVTFDHYLNNLHHYAQNYPVPFQSNLLKNGSLAGDIMWEDISLKKHAALFNDIFISKRDTYRIMLHYLPQEAENTNELLSKLRSQ